MPTDTKPNKQTDYQIGENDKVSTELIAMTYGSLIAQLISDMPDLDAVNYQLEKMGYQIGLRIADDFLAKTKTGFACQSFKEVIEAITQAGFPMYLGTSGETGCWNADGTLGYITFKDNPLTEFVTLPPTHKQLSYCAILLGIIRGVCEQMNFRVNCHMTKDMLRGADCYEIKVQCIQVLKNEFSDPPPN